MSSLLGACIIISLLSLSLANIPPKEHKSVDNNVCVGTCFSFSVPRTNPKSPGDDQLPYCDSCQASDSTWITVSLDCPKDHNLDKIEKSVEIIGNCSCMFCKEKPRHVPKPEEDDYEDDLENLKLNYDLQQLALKHRAMRNRNSANSATHTDHVTNNKHLDRLEEDPDDESESEGYLAVPVWNTLKAVLKGYFKIL